MDSLRAALAESGQNEEPSRAGARVLVVDENRTCCAVITQMLCAHGYDVVSVNKASDALAIVRELEDELDLVLTEIHLPDMDGLEFIESIDRLSNLPVVVTSSDDNPESMVSCMYKGALIYYVKPITMSVVESLWQFTHDGTELVWTHTLPGHLLRVRREIGRENQHKFLEYMKAMGLTDEDHSILKQTYTLLVGLLRQEVPMGKAVRAALISYFGSTRPLVQQLSGLGEESHTIVEAKRKEADKSFDVTKSPNPSSGEEDVGDPSLK